MGRRPNHFSKDEWPVGTWKRCSSSLITAAAAAKSCQLCPTLCDPIDGSPPGSSVPGILQERTVSRSIYRALKKGSSGGSVVKNPPVNAGDMGSIPESGRSPGEGNGNSLQYSCLENSMDRGA